jgi:extradiol dioxygenase family protein
MFVIEEPLPETKSLYVHHFNSHSGRLQDKWIKWEVKEVNCEMILTKAEYSAQQWG